MKERHKVVPASYLFLHRGNTILLMLRKNTGYYDGWYTVPSGHVEKGELPSEGMIREAKEEIGLDLDPASLRACHVMYRASHDETGERADYFFNCLTWQGEPQNVEPEKCAELAWFSVDALPENLMHHVKDALTSINAGIFYSEIDKAHVVQNPSRS